MSAKEFRVLIAGALFSLCIACSPGSVYYRQGRKAEKHKDYDTALINYDKALQHEPENQIYLTHQALVRTRAGNFHLKQGRRLLADNRQDAAIGEFQKAIGIDPSNEAAKQELQKLLEAQAAVKAKQQKAIQESMKEQEETLHAGVKLKPFPAAPIAHVHITADSRKVFETLAKLADVNVAFLQNFQSKPLSLDLTDVKLEDAFQIAAYSAGVFWKPITSNSILVIPDNPTNRREFEDEVLKTFYLSNPVSKDADRTAITTALKQILLIQKITDNPTANAIIIRDTPDKVAAAGELIRSLDLGKAEVLIDVTILETTLDRMRALGMTTVPLSGATQAAIGFTPRNTSNGNGSSSAPPSIPLNKLGKLSTADFSIALPGVIANALLTDQRTRILLNPQIRVTDGQAAKLNIGSRVPFATGSFLPSFGGTTGTPNSIGLLASTQFQYQDVGVKLEITPHLSANGEVGLHASIEISSVGAPASVGGVTQPTFNQRKVEHDIRLEEGEVSLLGGLIQAQEARTVSGLPFLGDIPFFRYFFTTENKEVQDNEVLIMLTPHVVRLPETMDQARAVMTGRETSGPPVPGLPGLPRGIPTPPVPPQQQFGAPQ